MIEWAEEDDRHYQSAAGYLALHFAGPDVKKLVKTLKRGPLTVHRVNDVLRASGLPLLHRDEPRVERDLGRINGGKPLEPILLLRGTPLVIADGYHRVCAVIHHDPDAEIQAKVVPHPDRSGPAQLGRR